MTSTNYFKETITLHCDPTSNADDCTRTTLMPPLDRGTLNDKIGYIHHSRYSQNMQRHNAVGEYKLYSGRRRKHWIETSFSKLIFNPFSFT